MPHPWLYLVENERSTLTDLLMHFVRLYTALQNKDGYQSWFAGWWKLWTRQGTGETASDVVPYNARWYFSHKERTRMLKLLNAFIEDAQRLDIDEYKIRSVQDLVPRASQLSNMYLPFDLDEQAHKRSDDELREVEKSSKYYKKRLRTSRRNGAEETHKPGRAGIQAPFKTPNIAECARLVYEGKPLESEYMPDEPVRHAHASSSANSLAHPLLHSYSHRQRAIYGI
ncbi:hypothetical protein JCM10296v2_007787 [Rhodotorula toruloides]